MSLELLMSDSDELAASLWPAVPHEDGMILMETCTRLRKSGLRHNRRPVLRLRAARSRQQDQMMHYTDRFGDEDLNSDSDMDDEAYTQLVHDRITRRIADKFDEVQRSVLEENKPNYKLMDEISWMMFEEEFHADPQDSPREYEEYEVEYLRRIEMRMRSQACCPYHAWVQKKTKIKDMKLGDWAMIKNQTVLLQPEMVVTCLQLDTSGELVWRTKVLKPVNKTLDFMKSKIKLELMRAHRNGTFSTTDDLNSTDNPVLESSNTVCSKYPVRTFIQRSITPHKLPYELRQANSVMGPIEFLDVWCKVNYLTSNLQQKVPFVIRATAELVRDSAYDLLRGHEVPSDRRSVFVADTMPFWVVSKASLVDPVYSSGGGALATQSQFASMRELRERERQTDSES